MPRRRIESVDEFTTSPKQLFTMKDVVRILGVSYPTIQRAVARGDIASVPFGESKLIRRTTIDRLLNEDAAAKNEERQLDSR